MRKLWVIYAIFAQFLFYFSAEANAGFQSKAGIETKVAYGVGKFFHEDHPSDTTFSNRIVFKIRYQRTIADVARVYNQQGLETRFTETGFRDYTTPLFIPLIRLLLFPKHYFW